MSASSKTQAAVSRGPRRRGMQGFTILEIMLATAILTLGLIGILALFPVAMNTGKQVVQTSTAAVIAQSVADAIREGVRNSGRTVTRNGITHKYFIFKHDGVKDALPARREAERADKDYFILLPRYKAGRDGRFAGRDVALRVAKTFLYPETDPVPNGNGDAFLADNDGDDERIPLSTGESIADVRVERTYEMGQFLPTQEAPEANNVLDDQRIDAWKQYSFAFSIRASYWDSNQSPTEPPFEPGNRLYNVRIMIFRAFVPPVSSEARAPVPDFELEFEVSA